MTLSEILERAIILQLVLSLSFRDFGDLVSSQSGTTDRARAYSQNPVLFHQDCRSW